jgi:DNA-binding beta-propeller fold protein YncE
MNMDGDNDNYMDVGTPITVGDGHKKSAFSDASLSSSAGNYFATHNLTSRSVSIINNPPDGTVVTRDLGASNIPHGLDFSPTSGHFYVGITNGVENAVSIIDATDANLPITHIPVGDPLNNAIPAAGYVHAHDSKVYTVGYVAGQNGEPGHGYLSIIDTTDDSVAQVIDLGDVSASSFNISHMEMDHGGGMTMVEMKAWIPSTSKGGEKDVVAVVSLDHMTGLQEDGTEVRHITIGAGGDHRNGKITPDGMHAIFPNGGDCGATHADHGPDCTSISIVDTMTETVIATVQTVGHEPGNIGIVDAAGVTGGSSGGGHDHTH